MPEAARAIGLQIQILNANTRSEIEAAFAAIARERVRCPVRRPDSFFTSRRGQLAHWRRVIGCRRVVGNRTLVEAGLLMSYGASVPDMFHQVGIYTGKILKGAKPADLPVFPTTDRTRHQPPDGEDAWHRRSRTRSNCAPTK